MANEKANENAHTILHLTDEEGVSTDFEVLDVLTHGGDDYVVLTAAEDTDEVIILRIVPVEGDEAEQYEGVGDEALMLEIFEEFKKQNGYE